MGYRWVDLLGDFEDIDEGRVFLGREYDDPHEKADASDKQGEPQGPPVETPAAPQIETPAAPQKKVWLGRSICDQSFKEGVITVEIEFEEVDWRCMADIILQYDPGTQDMLSFSLGGSVPEANGSNFFALRLWTSQQAAEANPGTGSSARAWKNIRWGGDRSSLKAARRYELVISVRGSALNVSLNGVNILKDAIPFQLPGMQVGIFCGGPKRIYFRKLRILPEKPQAFVVMQFNTPDYEALFREVITPACEKEGLRVYRADFTKKPGIIISDIVKHLTESSVIIAEVSPVNGNVYYEVGYADALKKPVILIADKTIGQLPFDVRPYRTIFYENSIGGKRLVEETLGEYLNNILTPQSF
jgi:hypothetical protein